MHVWTAPSLVASALAVSLFYIGFNIPIFSISQVLLMFAALWAMWRGRERGFAVPKTTLPISLSLYWAWLALTLLWTPVFYVSTTMFWWLSSLPMAFWIYTCLPARDRAWHGFALLLLLTGFAVGGYGVYQHFVLETSPRSLFLDINIHAALLNPIILPLCGYFLLFRCSKSRNDTYAMFLGTAFALLVYILMLTRSRGGILSFLLATAFLLAVAYRHVAKKTVMVVVGLIVAAYFLADLSWHGGLTDRAATLMELGSAGAERFSIWRQSWRLLFEQSPLWGIGLGIYSLAWPPYREPTDGSGGYFVHNDYLQIWIEAGLPGLLLFLAFLGSVAWLAWRILRQPRVPAPVRIESAGLIAAFGAIAMHSLVQYNFYVIPILMVCGLLLARLQELAGSIPAVVSGAWKLAPAGYFTSHGYYLLIVLLMLFPVGYFTSIGISAFQISRGGQLVAREQFDEADHALKLAQRFWPNSDTPLMARADLYRHAMTRVSVKDETQGSILFQTAEKLLAEAERLNPLRPHIFTLRAELYHQASSLAGPDWKAMAETSYRHALALDPRYFRARHGYALFLLAQAQEKEAGRVLEEGMRYYYSNSIEIMPYFNLTAWLRDRAGDHTGAAVLRQRMEEYAQDLGRKRAATDVSR